MVEQFFLDKAKIAGSQRLPGIRGKIPVGYNCSVTNNSG